MSIKIRFNAVIEIGENEADNLDITDGEVLANYIEHMLEHSDLEVDIISTEDLTDA